MEYSVLARQDFEELRRERIAILEGEHYRLGLRLAETSNPDDAMMLVAQQGELERRISLHRDQLTVGASQPDADPQENAATHSASDQP